MSDDTSQRKSRGRSAKAMARSVSDILGGVLEPIIARRTGMRLDLMRIWPELVGREFADTTRPEQIKWARRAHEEGAFEPALLFVACEPSCALFFQHEQSDVIKRVNEFFGFEAVDRIKILQKPVMDAGIEKARGSENLSQEDRIRLETMLEEIDDAELRKRLEALGKGIMGNAKRK